MSTEPPDSDQDVEGSAIPFSEIAEVENGVIFAQKSNCFVCHAALGKRKMKPRHHCRICMNTVCSACSQSSIQLDGAKDLQRACAPCVSNIQKVALLRKRLLHLNEGLRALRGEHVHSDCARSNIEDVLSLCENELEKTKQIHDITKAALEASAASLSQVQCELSHAQSRATACEAERLVERQERSALEEKMLAMEARLGRAEACLAEN
eukprot:TRINITY_DN12655_c0_g2_i2.p1 TRINITY_DN12655_c0_g2~~TRINITY_DN12655_c0_g2_i2.p1  ORF type:complete len:209 (+),score=30.52 TRINITY_DN12655_c0_g2_i2:89-715(+)